MSELSHLKHKLLAEQVEDQIYHYILDTPLNPGDKLPNEFALGERFGVGRSTIREAVKLLAEQNHMELPEMIAGREDAASRSEKERLVEANKQCARFFHSELWKKENAQILSYLYGRGLDDQTIRMFGLGSTPARSDGATQAMRALGFTDDELVRAGISVRRDGRVYDMFRQRAIFPIIDAQGRVLGFGGRALGDIKPKYLNTGDTPVFNKRLGVFAANLLKKQRGLKRVILVEGYMDVIALTQAGVPGVCATLGTALTIEQARLLKRYAPEIWVSYDGDAAGQKAILRALAKKDMIVYKRRDTGNGIGETTRVCRMGRVQQRMIVMYRWALEGREPPTPEQQGFTPIDGEQLPMEFKDK